MSGKKGASAKVAEKTIQDPELISMFNTMVGAQDPDLEMALPKFRNIMDNAQTILKILKQFISHLGDMLRKKGRFAAGLAEIEAFVAKSETALAALDLEKNDKVMTGQELAALNADPSKMQELLGSLDAYGYKVHNFMPKYKELKECSVVKEIIQTTSALKKPLLSERDRKSELRRVKERKALLETDEMRRLRNTMSPADFKLLYEERVVERLKVLPPLGHDLEDKATMSSDFIQQAEGDFLPLFSFSSLDFKQIYLQFYEVIKADKKIDTYILYVLHLVFRKGMEIVKLITQPDIDVEKFSQVLVENINSMRKMIPRCDQAFDKIKGSVGLLKDNFGEYYKDFVVSSNPAIIIENFVVDVAKGSQADPKVTQQFRSIIEFYQKRTRSQVTDPGMKKIFNMVESNLKILETKSAPRAETEQVPESPLDELAALDDLPTEKDE